MRKPYTKTMKALWAANEVMRSMYQIAIREGRDTNWPPFIERLKKELQVQHELMYPDQYLNKKQWCAISGFDFSIIL